MGNCTKKVLEEYFSRYGWAYRKLESGQIETGWQGTESVFPLVLTVYENWVGLQVRPFKRLIVDWDSWPEISQYLLEWNDGSHMVKLSIGPEGEIVINLDLMLHGLTFEMFADTLTVLGHYAEKLYDDLLNFLDAIGFSYCKSLDILA